MSMNAILTTTTSVAASIIAVCALVLTFRSWQDNRDKIRLDLFDRRFAIYQRVLSFYQELIVWQDRDDQKALIQPFIEASREALFIFPRKSGVYEYIQEFWNHTWKITSFKEASKPLRDCGMNQELAELANERVKHVNWILVSMTELEKLMKDSMSFERL
jgi:hypothetical protein